jgi:Cd2+/Zn2+-exporting ATPase
LVISTPVAVVSGLARAANRGVLIKGGAHLEALGRVTSIALDKTGTLTQGRFAVVDCFPMNGFTAAELHELVASVEAGSSHPLAEALMSHVGTSPTERPSLYETIEGEGVMAEVAGRSIVVGNHRMAERMGWHDPEEHRLLDAWMQEGRTVVYVGVDGVLAGLHSLADNPRSEAADAVKQLRALGVRIAMLTGDNAGAAEAVRRQVGLDEVQFELLPEDKVAAVRAMAKSGIVAMVGDGINDAPALAAADVGIAMGVRGTAVAMETADVALLTDDLRHLAEVIILGRRALSVIRRNIAFSIAVKALVLVLAVYGVATLWMAVAADVGATLLVVFHSMTLLRD